LIAAAQTRKQFNGFKIDRPSQPGIAIACRRADDRRKRNERVRIFDQPAHQLLIARISDNEVK
jgi:hypothetical protein